MSLTRLTLALALAWPMAFASPAPAANGACATPQLRAIIDPAQSSSQRPSILLRARGLSVPAEGRFEWGDGRFGIATIGREATGEPQVPIQPEYAAAGSYVLTMTVTDACGAATSLRSTVHVPLIVPPRATIPCPGVADVAGTCIVPPGAPVTFSVTGPGEGWDWTTDEPDRATSAEGGGLRLQLAAGGSELLQASRQVRDGWDVTPPLRVAALAPQRPPITVYQEPRDATAGRPVELAFTPPPGTETAEPGIMVDGASVATATTATVTLTEGTHDVTYQLSFADGGRIERRIVVLVRSAGLPLLPLLAGLGSLFAAAILLLLLMRRRRRRARAGMPTP